MMNCNIVQADKFGFKFLHLKSKEVSIIDDTLKHVFNHKLWITSFASSWVLVEMIWKIINLVPALLWSKALWKSETMFNIYNTSFFLRYYNTGGHRDLKNYKGGTFNLVCSCWCCVSTRNAFKRI